MRSPTDLDFRKSGCSGSGDNCVEIADLPQRTALRDSKHQEKRHFAIPSSEWEAFLGAARHGRLRLPPGHSVPVQRSFSHTSRTGAPRCTP
ncbi:DUF397 domain-containing protein [Nocardiopsis baichengensis]|uniref:DUF397 domain-containing protein n=1 Tax=Nocardiopsis baichengensis TaxID=280240 RepID=UPI000A068276|nr:DUF397 domain-containing protein [Nocardiopsis baichengensis]